MELHGTNWTGMAYGFLFRCFTKIQNWHEWQVDASSSLSSERLWATSCTWGDPCGRWGSKLAKVVQNAWACWSKVLYSTQSDLSNACDAVGLLNFFWNTASASFRPPAKNVWSFCNASTIEHILGSSKFLVTATSSGIHASALRLSYSTQSSFSLLSPRSISLSHFPWLTPGVVLKYHRHQLGVWVGLFQFFDGFNLNLKLFLIMS